MTAIAPSVSNSMLALFIPGKPIAFARALSNGKQRFTAPVQAGYAAAVGAIARSTMARAGYKPFEGPLEVVYRATFDWPSTWSQKRKDRIRWKTSKPDVDNAAKLCADALSGIAYLDDAQIVRLHAEKVYGFPVGVTVTVSQIGEDDRSPA